jgi:two-component system chemotaxis response regulator CheY
MKSVLIVEDSATTRAMIKAVIEEMGEDLTTLEAETGFEALRMLPQEQVDLIITDINMPDVNGLELINFVKSNPNYQHIPMIIVTTERSSSDKERGLALGASAYVTKPFKAEELEQVIAKALGR